MLSRAEYGQDLEVVEARKEMVDMCDELLTHWCRKMKDTWDEFVKALAADTTHPAATSPTASATYYFAGACLNGCEVDWASIAEKLAVEEDAVQDFCEDNIKTVFIDSWKQTQKHYSLAI